jgi:hypothetical protein
MLYNTCYIHFARCYIHFAECYITKVWYNSYIAWRNLPDEVISDLGATVTLYLYGKTRCRVSIISLPIVVRRALLSSSSGVWTSVTSTHQPLDVCGIHDGVLFRGNQRNVHENAIFIKYVRIRTNTYEYIPIRTIRTFLYLAIFCELEAYVAWAARIEGHAIQKKTCAMNSLRIGWPPVYPSHTGPGRALQVVLSETMTCWKYIPKRVLYQTVTAVSSAKSQLRRPRHWPGQRRRLGSSAVRGNFRLGSTASARREGNRKVAILIKCYSQMFW